MIKYAKICKNMQKYAKICKICKNLQKSAKDNKDNKEMIKKHVIKLKIDFTV
jgi:hypothetical protein